MFSRPASSGWVGISTVPSPSGAVAVQIAAHEAWDIAQRGIVQLLAGDLRGRHHLLALIVEPQQHRGQIIARDARPAVQHQIVLSVRTEARRHRSAARELIARQCHNGHLLETSVLIDGQQLDLDAAVFQRGHQDKVFAAAAGDVLHEVLLISLLEDGRHLAVLIGVNGQIVVILRSRIAHDELGRAARLKLSQPDIVHRIGQALYGLAHLPGTPAVLA